MTCTLSLPAFALVLAGLVMLELGLVLIAAPELLNSAGIAVLLLCMALLLTLLAARFPPD